MLVRIVSMLTKLVQKYSSEDRYKLGEARENITQR